MSNKVGKGRIINWETEIMPRINQMYGTTHTMLADALLDAFKRNGNSITQAAAVIGVSWGAFKRQIEKTEKITQYKRTAPPPKVTHTALERIHVVFDYKRFYAEGRPDISVCHFCSNKFGDKYNLTCVHECPARQAWVHFSEVIVHTDRYEKEDLTAYENPPKSKEIG